MRELLFRIVEKLKIKKVMDHPADEVMKSCQTESLSETLTWDDLQYNADCILYEGLNILKAMPHCDFTGKYAEDQGNYIISYEEKSLYIGEADNLDKRLRDHYRGSTFFKNYCQNGHKLNLPLDLTMNHFRHQHMQVSFGRKDLEEFGMVNLPAPLNKFQTDKRPLFVPKNQTFLWEVAQETAPGLLKQGEEKLFSERRLPWDQPNIYQGAGVYLIFDPEGRLIYAGESTNVADRHKTHSTKTRFSAFRRSVATNLFSFTLKTKEELGFKSSDSKKSFLTKKEDEEINKYINQCKFITMPVNFGRLELEAQIIKNYSPLLNRKGRGGRE